MLEEHAHLLRRVVRAADGRPVQCSISSQNKQLLVIRLACEQHLRHLQLRSLVRSEQEHVARPGGDSGECEGHAGAEAPCPALYCRICDYPKGLGMCASRHERRCYALLAERFPNLQPVQEVWAHGRRVDVMISGLGLAVMVDGEQHFPSKGSGHHTKSSWDQAVRDAEFNSAVMAGQVHGVKGVARLHFADRPDEWHAKLSQALEYARDASVQAFIVLTAAYMCPGTVARTL